MKFRAMSDNQRKLNLNWDLIFIYVSRWKPETWFDIEIVRKQAKKSDPMRKYYFGAVLPPFMDHLGYERDEDLLFHHLLKVTYFKRTHDVYQDKKGMWRNVPSVFSNESDLGVSIKKEFVDWVVRKAAQEGCYIEDPS